MAKYVFLPGPAHGHVNPTLAVAQELVRRGERVRIQVLMQQGTLKALYFASDFSGVWLVMQGEAQDQVQKSLESLPLYPYMQLTITPLSRM